ncbi:MAG TPA: hypothetical protein VG405_06755 [Solirubrobacteraceae bacterium]|nr:hypothetical protein [Solirubrobacteraceae bacterium]
MGATSRLTQRLVRLYPPDWRARYGEEFEQLLLDELAEERPKARWWLNLLGHAVLARLVEFGIAGNVEGRRRIDAALRLAAGGVVLGLLCATAMWAQLAVGWQWSAPSSQTTRSAVELITVGLIGLGITATGLAAGSLLAAVSRGRLAQRRPQIALGVLCLCIVLLILGSGSIGLSWPGTGGHAWAGRSLVPAWLGRRAWALTLWLSSYWAHPRRLAQLGPTQLEWMLVSPVLMGAAVWSWRSTVGPVRSGRLPRWITLGAVLTAAASIFLIAMGAAAWSLGGRSGPHGLFVPGAIDVALLMVTGLLSVACALLARQVWLTPKGTLTT